MERSKPLFNIRYECECGKSAIDVGIDGNASVRYMTAFCLICQQPFGHVPPAMTNDNYDPGNIQRTRDMAINAGTWIVVLILCGLVMSGAMSLAIAFIRFLWNLTA